MAKLPLYLVDANIIGMAPRACAKCPMSHERVTCKLYRRVIKRVDPNKARPKWCKLLSVTLVMSEIDPRLIANVEDRHEAQ